jgi:N-acylneuraminate cytidylyltransferase
MARRIAIIPARGGSKRIPRKNVKPFGGIPMIGHILGTAKASGLFDVIHVSTEDADVRATVEGLGFTIDFPRPADLADDHTPIMPVLKHVVETYEAQGTKFDEVWLLMACAPFIEVSDLRAAADIFSRAGGRRSVLAVAPYPVPVEWAYRRAPDGALEPLQPGMFAVRSQDIEPKYYDTGTFAILSRDTVAGSVGAGSDTGFLGHVIDKDKAIDIDDEEDWKLAESMFKNRAGGTRERR